MATNVRAAASLLVARHGCITLGHRPQRRQWLREGLLALRKNRYGGLGIGTTGGLLDRIFVVGSQWRSLLLGSVCLALTLK